MSAEIAAAVNILDSLDTDYCWAISRSRVCGPDEYRLQVWERKQQPPLKNWGESALGTDVVAMANGLLKAVATRRLVDGE